MRGRTRTSTWRRHIADRGSGGEQPRERGQVHRLHEVQIETGIEGALSSLRQPVARQRDERRVTAVTLAGADAARDLVPVDAGQADVDERDLRRRVERGRETRDAVTLRAHAMTAELQQLTEREPRVVVVFDDEDVAVEARRR